MTEAPAGGRALFGPASVYALVSAVQAFAAVLVVPAMTRELGPVEYGVIATCLAVYQLLQAFVTVGLPVAAAWAVYEGTDEGFETARRLAATGVAVAACIAGAIHVTGSLWAPPILEISYGASLILAVALVVPGTALACAQAILQAERRAGAFATCTLASAVGGQVLGFGVVFTTDHGAAGYLAGLLIGALSGAAFGFSRTGASLARLIPPRAAWAAVRDAGPTVVHGAAFIVLASADRLIVERLLGLEAAGRYHVSYLVGSVGMVAALALNNAWAPLIHRASDEDRWTVLRDTSAHVHDVASIVAGGLAIGAPLGLAVFAPASYRPDDLTPVTAIVAASLMPYATYLSGVHVLFQHKRVVPLAVSTVVAGAANVGLNLILIPAAGLVGSALATLFGYMLWAWMVRRAARQQVDVVWRNGAAVRSYASAAVLVVLGAIVPVTGPWLVVRSLLGAVLVVWLIVQIRG